MPDRQNAVSNTTEKATRGFGAMDPQKQKEIAQRGGRAAHAKGVAHKYSVDEARSAGRKGGQAISANRAHMSEIGRLGGLARRTGRTNTEPVMNNPTEKLPPHHNGDADTKSKEAEEVTPANPHSDNQ